jgi:hypothetical protein
LEWEWGVREFRVGVGSESFKNKGGIMSFEGHYPSFFVRVAELLDFPMAFCPAMSKLGNLFPTFAR